MMETLSMYFRFPFVRYALIVGGLIAMCSSLLGVTLVLKRFSFIGDGLSHVAFGAMAVAGVIKPWLESLIHWVRDMSYDGLAHRVVRFLVENDMFFVMPVTILSAVLLLRRGKHARVQGDAAIAMISVGALALGYLILNLFSMSSNLSGDVCSTLFGSTSILTLTQAEVWLCAGFSLAAAGLFVCFYDRIFAVTFDEDFSRAVGVRADACNLLIAVVVAVIIVLAMNLVGSLLISALIIFPALSAMRIARSFKGVTLCSLVLSVLCAGAGILLSILAGTPVGSTIVAVDILMYFVFAVIGRFILRR